jgi:uncharacterized membrane protein YbhN (UPF0104 family)
MSATVGHRQAHTAGRSGGPVLWVRRWWKPALGAVIVCLAGALLYRTLSRYSFGEIVGELHALPLKNILAAAGFAAASYATLTLFDFFGLRYAGHRLPYGKAALASFTALSLGHNIGFAALSSGAVRYRFYSRWGLDAEDVAKIILFCATTVGIGLATLAAVALLLQPVLAARMIGLSEGAVFALAATIVAALVGYIAAAWRLRRPIHIRKWTFEMPTLRLALAQLVIGSVNFAFVAACLHQALATAEASYFQVACAYVLANLASIVSHVPGGLGVIESVVAMLLPGGKVIGGLVLFRAIYFLVPLCFGLLSFFASELTFKGKQKAKA